MPSIRWRRSSSWTLRAFGHQESDWHAPCFATKWKAKRVKQRKEFFGERGQELRMSQQRETLSNGRRIKQQEFRDENGVMFYSIKGCILPQMIICRSLFPELSSSSEQRFREISWELALLEKSSYARIVLGVTENFAEILKGNFGCLN